MRKLLPTPGRTCCSFSRSTSRRWMCEAKMAFKCRLLRVNINCTSRQKHDNNQREHCFYHHEYFCWPCQRKGIGWAKSCGASECQEEIINEMGSPFCSIAIHLLRKHKISSLVATI